MDRRAPPSAGPPSLLHSAHPTSLTSSRTFPRDTSMLDDDLKAQLKAYLGYLKRPIVLSAALDASEASSELRALLADVAEASPLVSVKVLDEVPAGVRCPSFAVHAEGEEARVRFAGLPLGHEFTSLVLALLHVGGHPPKVSDEALEQVKALEGPLDFET